MSKKKDEKPQDMVSVPEQDMVSVPEGFQIIATGERLYWVKLVGDQYQSIRGIVRRFEERPPDDEGEIRFMYLLQLTDTAYVTTGEKEQRIAMPGEMVIVDETYQLGRDLSPIVRAAARQGKTLEVIIRARAHVPVRGTQRTVWRFHVVGRLNDKSAALPEGEGDDSVTRLFREAAI